METEENQPTEQEPQQMTLMLPHDAAVAIAAAAIHYGAWFKPNIAMKPTIKHLDETVELILQQPLLSAEAQTMLHDMQAVMATLEEVERGGKQHVETRRTQGER